MAPPTFDRATDEELRTPTALPDVLLEGKGPDAETRMREAPLATETDPVRLYFGEMGKVPLLTAAQEVEIGHRIETGRADLQRALGVIPMAVRALAQIGERLREDPRTANAVLVLPDRAEPSREALAPIVRSFDRLRRWSKSMTARRTAIQALVESLPLQPALIDDLVGRVRAASAKEAEVTVLDEIEQRDAAAEVALGDGDHEAQIGLRQLPLGLADSRVCPLDLHEQRFKPALREPRLLRRGRTDPTDEVVDQRGLQG